MNHSDQPPGAGAADLQPGSIEATLAGQADVRVGAVLTAAWAHTRGVRSPILAGSIAVFILANLVSHYLGGWLGINVEALLQNQAQNPLATTLLQVVLMMIVYPFMGGVFLFGLRHSVGRPVRFDDLFAQYRRMLPIVAVALVQSMLTGIGFALLIIPGLYLSFALILAVPLKVERDLPLAECLLTSIRLVNRKFLEVVLLMLAVAGLLALGVVSLIGWIWTVPWTVMIFVILYRQLAGVGDSVSPPAGPGGRITAEY
jgi:hypothetical protein